MDEKTYSDPQVQVIIDDPSPGLSVSPTVEITAGSSHLEANDRAALYNIYDHAYDRQHGGWGEVHKFIDAAALELTYSNIDSGDRTALRRAPQTLDANLQLIDPVWGGVYQYSDSVD